MKNEKVPIITSPWGLCLAMKIKNAIILVLIIIDHYDNYSQNHHLDLQEID